MMKHGTMIGIVSLLLAGAAQAQLDKPLPQAMMGESVNQAIRLKKPRRVEANM